MTKTEKQLKEIWKAMQIIQEILIEQHKIGEQQYEISRTMTELLEDVHSELHPGMGKTN